MASTTRKQDEKYVAEFYSNTQSNLIEITEDKLEITIMRFLEKFIKANSWLTPFSIATAIIFTLLTSEVNKALFNIPKEIWNGMFYVSLFASIIWLLISVVNFFRFRKESKLETLICKIKNISQ